MKFVLIFFFFYSAFAGPRWISFCERYLIADDPYQFENLTVDQLVDAYFSARNSGLKTKPVLREIIKRTKSELSRDDLEILTKLMNQEER